MIKRGSCKNASPLLLPVVEQTRKGRSILNPDENPDNLKTTTDSYMCNRVIAAHIGLPRRV